MALLLGIDTGGTFTDAAIVDDDDAGGDRIDGVGVDRVVATAKAATTHHDLALGVASAVQRVLRQVGPDAAPRIALVSVSTTLATNALVEGHGEPAGLLTFGFSEREISRAGLGAAVPAELIVCLEGGHDAHGNEASPLDVAAIEAAARRLAPNVTAFAVAAQFSVRNPAHELAVAGLIRSVTGRPVTSSHELSARLDGPRRALTAALNARLLGTIDRLNAAVRLVLDEAGIGAPLMVVRGDGSLVSARFAAERPIETVLSGPAASVMGALHLGGLENGVVVDIGGTTTDVAIVRNGRPSITDGGAIIGNHRTMVEAVAMATIGLGGDSEVTIDARAAAGPVLLGPERAVPICRLAVSNPEIHAMLDRQFAAPTGLTTHGRFLVSVAPADIELTDAREIEVLARLDAGPMTLEDAAPSGLSARAAARLRARGLVRVATMTPTDAHAVLGALEGVDRDAAAKVAQLLARQTGSTGAPIAPDGVELSERVLEVLMRRSAEFVVRVAFDTDGITIGDPSPVLAASLRGHRGTAFVSMGLVDPITAIGAPAAAYYPRVADLLRTRCMVPDHAEVANAIGAVVGKVRVRRTATITQPTRGQFRMHLDDQPTFGSVENAREAAMVLLEDRARHEAERAGAASLELTSDWTARTATIGGKEVLVEATVTVEATGRPRF